MTKTEIAAQLRKDCTAYEKAEEGAYGKGLKVAEDLAEARKVVPQGQWEAWLRKHFPWSIRTAQRWLVVHKYRAKVEATFKARQREQATRVSFHGEEGPVLSMRDACSIASGIALSERMERERAREQAEEAERRRVRVDLFPARRRGETPPGWKPKYERWFQQDERLRQTQERSRRERERWERENERRLQELAEQQRTPEYVRESVLADLRERLEPLPEERRYETLSGILYQVQHLARLYEPFRPAPPRSFVEALEIRSERPEDLAEVLGCMSPELLRPVELDMDEAALEQIEVDLGEVEDRGGDHD